MIYLIDTSSLICLVEQYPKDIFKTLYKNCDTEIINGKIKAPEQVLHEIKRKDDTLYKWVMGYKKLFIIDTSNRILQRAAEIVNSYPELVKNSGLTAYGDDPADPYLIATAISLVDTNIETISDIKIITEEGNKKNHIPDIAHKYNIETIHILEFFKEMKWEF